MKLLAGRFYKWFIQAVRYYGNRIKSWWGKLQFGKTSEFCRNIFISRNLQEAQVSVDILIKARERKTSSDLENLNAACSSWVIKLQCPVDALSERTQRWPRITSNQRAGAKPRFQHCLCLNQGSTDTQTCCIPREHCCHYTSLHC